MNRHFSSKLTKTEAAPLNIDKQKVAFALCLFCDATVAALKSLFIVQSSKNKAEFIAQIVNLFKTFNTKTPFQERRFNDPNEMPWIFQSLVLEALKFFQIGPL